MEKQMKKFIIIALSLISLNVNAQEKYMKLEDGGYVTITDLPCEINNDIVKERYPYKAILTAKSSTQILEREGCWNRDEPSHPKLAEYVYVHVVEQILLEDGKAMYNIGSFGQYYFKDTKE
jgi:hypothetical protein